MLTVDELIEPAVRAVVTAINTGDRVGFFAALTPDATLTDDGTKRDLAQWADREIFISNGRMDVVSQSDDGHSLIADFRNDTWGQMRTAWRFAVTGGKVSRIDTGQA